MRHRSPEEERRPQEAVIEPETGIMHPATGRWRKIAFLLALSVAGLFFVGIMSAGLQAAFECAAFLAVAWGIRQREAGAAMLAATVLLTPVLAVLIGGEPARAGLLPVRTLLGAMASALMLLAFLEMGRVVTLPWLAATLAITMLHLFLRPFSMPTASMEPAIQNGDYILVETLSWRLGRPPRRGQVLAFRYPPDRRQNSVKRVVGVPGDRLSIRDKQLYRNGATAVEPYVIHSTAYTDRYRDNFPSPPSAGSVSEGALDMLDTSVRYGEVVVPPGKYFVLGDNRDASLDSRYFGFVERADIIGMPLLVYDSHDLSQSDIPMLFNQRWRRWLTVPR